MKLPFDYYRCVGMTNSRTKASGTPERMEPQCNDCRRREPGHPDRQVYIAPAWTHDDGCPNYIDSKQNAYLIPSSAADQCVGKLPGGSIAT